MKPIIGIVGKADSASDDDKVICSWESIRRAVVKKGGIPVMILPTQEFEFYTTKPKEASRLNEQEKEDIKKVVNMCDGILFPGGYIWYEFDEFVYEYSSSLDLPILGICCGMQMIGCMDNDKKPGILVKNETEINHHQREEKYVHNVKIVENTLLKEIVDKNVIKVNSKHNGHIIDVNNLKISAYSEDGLIEAVENPNKKFILGVQWHPESMLEYDEFANKIFDAFIDKCKSKN